MGKLPSFSTYRSPKNTGTINLMFGGRFGDSQRGEEYGLSSTFPDFFIKEKCASEEEERILYKPNEEIGGIFVYRTLKSFQKFKSKFKNIKHVAFNILSWAYPMVSLSGRSNLVGEYLISNIFLYTV